MNTVASKQFSTRDLQDPERLCEYVAPEQIPPSVASDLVASGVLSKLVPRLHAYLNLWNIFRLTSTQYGGPSSNFCDEYAGWLRSDTKVATCVAKEIVSLLSFPVALYWRDAAMVGLYLFHAWFNFGGPLDALFRFKAPMICMEYVMSHLDCKDPPQLELALEVLEDLLFSNSHHADKLKPEECATALAKIGSEHAVRPLLVCIRAFAALAALHKSRAQELGTAFLDLALGTLSCTTIHPEVLAEASYVLACVVPGNEQVAVKCRCALSHNSGEGLARLVGILLGGPGVPQLPSKSREKVYLLLGNLMYNQPQQGDPSFIDETHWNEWIEAVVHSGLLPLSKKQLDDMVSARESTVAMALLGFAPFPDSGITRPFDVEQQLHDLLDAANMMVENLLDVKAHPLLLDSQPSVDSLAESFTKASETMEAINTKLQEMVALGQGAFYGHGSALGPDGLPMGGGGGSASKGRSRRSKAGRKRKPGTRRSGRFGAGGGEDGDGASADQETTPGAAGGPVAVEGSMTPGKRHRSGLGEASDASKSKRSSSRKDTGVQMYGAEEDNASLGPNASASAITVAMMLKPAMDAIGASRSTRNDPKVTCWPACDMPSSKEACD
eukprot:gene4955-34734_t